MKVALALIRRNTKLFFKDKGMFFTSLITPAILLLLYVTFLSGVYRDSFALSLPIDIIPEKVINGLVGGQLISSLLAVSCVTVAFCSNFLMVQDKVSGARKDFGITPVSHSVMSLSYYVAAFLSTLIVCFCALVISLIYIACVGWYLSLVDVLAIVLDIILVTLFGMALSSVINLFLTSQGQISAVGSIVSSCYGFICGAYMPISSFGDWLRNTVAFLPGTHGTSLMRNHAMRGAIAELDKLGVASESLNQLRDAVDCNIYCFDNLVSTSVSYLILIGTTLALLAVYLILNKKVKRK